MSIYKQIHDSICSRGKQRTNQYKKHSGLHKHRIDPGYNGGLYHPDNITYLTVREHIIVHFLLYKLHRNPNDLRSMKMLGANLTPDQRRVVGEWCRDNKIGIYKLTTTQRQLIGKYSYKINIEKQTPFAYWASDAGRKHRASLGGKASAAKQHGNIGFQKLPAKDRVDNAKKANLAQPKKPATNGITTRRFYTETDREAFLVANPSWRAGHHWSKTNSRASF